MQDTSLTPSPFHSDSSSAHLKRDTLSGARRKSLVLPVKKDTIHQAVKQPDQNKQVLLLKKDTIDTAAKSSTINLYGTHELKVIHREPQPLRRDTPDWVFPLLILIIAAFAWLRTFYHKYFNQLITAFFNNNLTNQIVRDENILVQRASILLNIVFNLVGALFLFFVSVHFNWPLGGIGPGLNRYLFFALLVSGTYALKFLVLKICGYLFHLEKEMAAYIFNIFLINNVLGILFIPIVAMLAFSSSVSTAWIIYGSLVLVAGAFIYQVVRGLFIGIASPVSSLYYLFLYLCTLEFAPLLVLIKVVNQK
jgi:hypothetical protein